MACAQQRKCSDQKAHTALLKCRPSLSSMILGAERNDTFHADLQKLIECLDDFLKGETQPAKYSNLLENPESCFQQVLVLGRIDLF